MHFLQSPVVVRNPNRRVPLAAVLSFRPSEPVRTRVQIDDGQRRWTLEFGQEQSPERGLPILGLRPDRAHALRTTIIGHSGAEKTAAEVLRYRTPALPPGYDFPHGLRVLRNVRARREPGVLLLSIHRIPTGRYQDWTQARADFGFAWGIIVALDEEGEVIWHYIADSFVEGIDRLRNGNLLFHQWDFHSFEIDMLGNTVNHWCAARRPQSPAPGAIQVDTAGLHHQPQEMPNGNFLIFTAEAREIDNCHSDHFNLEAPRRKALVVGDGVAEMDRRSGELLWRWSAFDHLDPMRIGYGATDDYWTLRGFAGALDWTHGNGASYDARDDSVVLSLRHQDALIKVDRASGRIKWILGEPEGWGRLSDRLLKPVNLARWPYHGHNPRVTPEGTLMFFDNGTWGARPPKAPVPPHRNFSRAVEYRVDEERMTVEEVWASARTFSETAPHSPDMGDAHKLPRTGNRLAIWAHCVAPVPGQSYSNRDRSGIFFNELSMPSLLREYAGDDSSDIVFELKLHDANDLVNWGIYGGLVVPSLHPGRGAFADAAD